jgi:hypothetical protein
MRISFLLEKTRLADDREAAGLLGYRELSSAEARRKRSN